MLGLDFEDCHGLRENAPDKKCTDLNKDHFEARMNALDLVYRIAKAYDCCD